jgi:hypothetical protein
MWNGNVVADFPLLVCFSLLVIALLYSCQCSCSRKISSSLEWTDLLSVQF